MNWPSLLIGAAVGSAVTASLYALCRKPAEPTSNEKLDHIANLIIEQGVLMNEALAEIATEVTALKGAVASSTAAEFIRTEAFEKGYAEATADAMKVARQEDPIHVAMVPLSDALRAREKVGYDKGYEAARTLLAALADQIEATAGNEAAARELAAAIRTETGALSAAVAANDGDPNT